MNVLLECDPFLWVLSQRCMNVYHKCDMYCMFRCLQHPYNIYVHSHLLIYEPYGAFCLCATYDQRYAESAENKRVSGIANRGRDWRDSAICGLSEKLIASHSINIYALYRDDLELTSPASELSAAKSRPGFHQSAGAGQQLSPIKGDLRGILLCNFDFVYL